MFVCYSEQIKTPPFFYAPNTVAVSGAKIMRLRAKARRAAVGGRKEGRCKMKKENKMETQATVQKYMVEIIQEHTDPVTGEVCPTRLAEDACLFFDDYGPAPDYDIPEEYFEWAFQISEV